jgi:G3E family GTPase
MSLFSADRSHAKCPVMILTGALGSGKTTLLNRLLGDPAMAGTLVIMNELGEIGLDHLLVRASTAGREVEMVLLPSGCLCCAVQSDLEATLRDITAAMRSGEAPPIGRIVIETTGIADPAATIGLILTNPFVAHDYALQAVITCVDTVNLPRQLASRPEAIRQIALADRLVLTKTDLTTDTDRDATLALLDRLAPHLPRHDAAAPAAILFAAPPPAAALRSVPQAGPDHLAGISALSLTADRPLDWMAVDRFLRMLREGCPDQLLRVKGLLDIAGEAGPLVIHGVHRLFHPPVRLSGWPDGIAQSRLVLILDGIAPEALFPLWAEVLATPATLEPPVVAAPANG